MDTIVACGLFELIAALGLVAVARAIYSRHARGIAFRVTSIAFQIALLILARGEAAKWLGTARLATTPVNAPVIAAVLQRGHVPYSRWAEDAANRCPLACNRWAG